MSLTLGRTILLLPLLPGSRYTIGFFKCGWNRHLRRPEGSLFGSGGISSFLPPCQLQNARLDRKCFDLHRLAGLLAFILQYTSLPVDEILYVQVFKYQMI